MTEQLERSAEITKLARLLDVTVKDLAYLEHVSAAALAEFREQVTDRLFAGDAGRLKRVAMSSKLLPIPLTVKIAQLAFGPMLCAATSGLIEPERAARISARVPIPFLGDIATMMDPRRAADVIAAVPAQVVAQVGRHLIERDEYVTMGRFVSFLPRETLRVALQEIPDDAALLRVAFVLEGKDRLDELLDVARDRILGLIRAAHEHDMWGEVLDLISNLNLANRAELGDLAATQDDDVLDALIGAAQRMQAWPDLLPVIAAMSPPSLHRLLQVPAVLETDVLDQIATAATQHDGWGELLPIAAVLPPEARRRLVALPLVQRDDVLAAIIDAAVATRAWPALVPLVAELPPDPRRRAAQAIGRLPAPVLTAALAELGSVLTADLAPSAWAALVEIKDDLPDPVRRAIVVSAQGAGRDDVVAVLSAGSGRAARPRPRPEPRADPSGL
ncbi:MAG TPA: hypothetical protein VGN18_17285 [Jatrophihabitans sp.]|jgi:hypothetical protein|uniref:hypothetical protein n=1 Tax=Jatrophihabitans sp. TaxID=1932789 RepID=UPI002DFCCF5A|nr:hypothetical protein [Jatrophihabitans sp.]